MNSQFFTNTFQVGYQLFRFTKSSQHWGINSSYELHQTKPRDSLPNSSHSPHNRLPNYPTDNHQNRTQGLSSQVFSFSTPQYQAPSYNISQPTSYSGYDQQNLHNQHLVHNRISNTLPDNGCEESVASESNSYHKNYSFNIDELNSKEGINIVNCGTFFMGGICHQYFHYTNGVTLFNLSFVNKYLTKHRKRASAVVRTQYFKDLIKIFGFKKETYCSPKVVLLPWEIYIMGILIGTNLPEFFKEVIKPPDISQSTSTYESPQSLSSPSSFYEGASPSVRSTQYGSQISLLDESTSPSSWDESPPLFNLTSESPKSLSSPTSFYEGASPSVRCTQYDSQISLLDESTSPSFFNLISESPSQLVPSPEQVNTFDQEFMDEPSDEEFMGESSDEEYMDESSGEEFMDESVFGGEQTELLSMDAQTEIQNIEDTNCKKIYTQLIEILKKTKKLKVPKDIDTYTLEQYRKFLYDAVVKDNPKDKQKQIQNFFAILEAKDIHFLSLTCLLGFLKHLKSNDVIKIETEILRRSFATFNSYFKKLPHGDEWKVTNNSVEVPFKFVLNLWSEVISTKFNDEEGAPNEGPNHPFKTDKDGNIYLDVRCTWDGRTKVRWGNVVFMVIPLIKYFDPQNWISVFPLITWKGKETKEDLIKNCSSICELVDAANKGELTFPYFDYISKKEISVRVRFIAAPDLKAADLTYDKSNGYYDKKYQIDFERYIFDFHTNLEKHEENNVANICDLVKEICEEIKFPLSDSVTYLKSLSETNDFNIPEETLPECYTTLFNSRTEEDFNNHFEDQLFVDNENKRLQELKVVQLKQILQKFKIKPPSGKRNTKKILSGIIIDKVLNIIQSSKGEPEEIEDEIEDEIGFVDIVNDDEIKRIEEEVFKTFNFSDEEKDKIRKNRPQYKQWKTDFCYYCYVCRHQVNYSLRNPTSATFHPKNREYPNYFNFIYLVYCTLHASERMVELMLNKLLLDNMEMREWMKDWFKNITRNSIINHTNIKYSNATKDKSPKEYFDFYKDDYISSINLELTNTQVKNAEEFSTATVGMIPWDSCNLIMKTMKLWLPDLLKQFPDLSNSPHLVLLWILFFKVHRLIGANEEQAGNPEFREKAKKIFHAFGYLFAIVYPHAKPSYVHIVVLHTVSLWEKYGSLTKYANQGSESSNKQHAKVAERMARGALSKSSNAEDVCRYLTRMLLYRIPKRRKEIIEDMIITNKLWTIKTNLHKE